MTTTPRRPDLPESNRPGSAGPLVFAWLFVCLPLAWGVWQTILKSLALFH